MSHANMVRVVILSVIFYIKACAQSVSHWTTPPAVLSRLGRKHHQLDQDELRKPSRSRGAGDHFWLAYYVASLCRLAEAICCRRRVVMQRLAVWSTFSRPPAFPPVKPVISPDDLRFMQRLVSWGRPVIKPGKAPTCARQIAKVADPSRRSARLSVLPQQRRQNPSSASC